jgi:hypothetical protein
MEHRINGRTVGHGDDVLQLFDLIAATHIGRHRQTEAAVRGCDSIDRQLVIDECAAALTTDTATEPVRECARQALLAIDVDPDGPITRLNAGEPTLERLRRADRVRETVDRAKQGATTAASTGIDAATRGLDRAARRWLERSSRSGGSE